MLVLDSFRDHTTNPVKNQLVEKNTNIAVIPGGCTSKLQPLDVTINKSFKSKVKLHNLFLMCCISYLFIICRLKIDTMIGCHLLFII